MKVLNANDPNFAEQFREAVGAKPGEEIHIKTPQFERTDGHRVPDPPADLSLLPKMTENELRLLGCQKWDGDHWLYPGEWYDKIPEGHEMLCIDGTTEKFKKGETDDDTRMGALAFGFLRQSS